MFSGNTVMLWWWFHASVLVNGDFFAATTWGNSWKMQFFFENRSVHKNNSPWREMWPRNSIRNTQGSRYHPFPSSSLKAVCEAHVLKLCYPITECQRSVCECVLSDVCPRNRFPISGCLRPGCKREMMHLILACSIMGGVICVADSPSTTSCGVWVLTSVGII